MKNCIQDYPWGSFLYLQELLGLDDKGPLAELWMGVHPRGMSQVVDDEGKFSALSDYIAKNPAPILGEDVNSTFSNLPYLFKLLAAGEPLSIQAHPNKQQAEEGFQRENREGVPLDAFHRNYKDDNHKPEIICALTEYWAMKGFRSEQSIKEYFAEFCTDDAAEQLFPLESENSFHKTFFIALMNLPDDILKGLLDAALQYCADQDDDACRWVLKLQDKYPGDPGILSPLYLNTLCLNPGEALYLPAGELHAYLQGFGVELMANSDNVLRGGLTQKHMDMKEMENNLHFEASEVERLLPDAILPGLSVYKTESREFELLTVEPEGRSVVLEDSFSASILIVTEGSLSLKDDDSHITVQPGESCFLPFSEGPRIIEGSGKAYMARVPAG